MADEWGFDYGYEPDYSGMYYGSEEYASPDTFQFPDTGYASPEFDYSNLGNFPSEPLSPDPFSTSLPEWQAPMPMGVGYGQEPMGAQMPGSAGAFLDPTQQANDVSVGGVPGFSHATGALDEAPAPPSLQDRYMEAMVRRMEGQDQGGLLGIKGLTGDSALGAALKAGGGLLGLLAPGPKMDPLMKAKLQAEIDKINAERDAIKAGPRGGGGGGGGVGPLPPGGAPNIAQFLGAAGLGGNPGRFSALYDQINKETADLPKPDDAKVSQRAMELETAGASSIHQQIEQLRNQAREEANRLGTNPAGRLALLDKQEAQSLSELHANAHTQALADLQSQSAQLIGRLTPAMQLLAQVNPTGYADVLARVFGTPTPGQQASFIPNPNASSLTAALGG